MLRGACLPHLFHYDWLPQISTTCYLARLLTTCKLSRNWQWTPRSFTPRLERWRSCPSMGFRLDAGMCRGWTRWRRALPPTQPSFDEEQHINLGAKQIRSEENGKGRKGKRQDGRRGLINRKQKVFWLLYSQLLRLLKRINQGAKRPKWCCNVGTFQSIDDVCALCSITMCESSFYSRNNQMSLVQIKQICSAI